MIKCKNMIFSTYNLILKLKQMDFPENIIYFIQLMVIIYKTLLKTYIIYLINVNKYKSQMIDMNS